MAIALPIFFSHQTGNAQSPVLRFLSDADESAVLAWIANETAAEKAPYCYRQSYGRGVGTVVTEAGANRVQIIDAMIPHHQGAVKMANVAQQKSKRRTRN